MTLILWVVGSIVTLLLLAQVNVWLKTTWLFRPRRPRPFDEEQLEAELHRRLQVLAWLEIRPFTPRRYETPWEGIHAMCERERLRGASAPWWVLERHAVEDVRRGGRWGPGRSVGPAQPPPQNSVPN